MVLENSHLTFECAGMCRREKGVTDLGTSFIAYSLGHTVCRRLSSMGQIQTLTMTSLRCLKAQFSFLQSVSSAVIAEGVRLSDWLSVSVTFH